MSLRKSFHQRKQRQPIKKQMKYRFFGGSEAPFVLLGVEKPPMGMCAISHLDSSPGAVCVYEYLYEYKCANASMPRLGVATSWGFCLGKLHTGIRYIVFEEHYSVNVCVRVLS